MSESTPELPRIPGYAVEAELGSGGMATVYRARQVALDRPVAIKVLRAYGRDAEQLMRRFEQEAKLIAALDHPGIVAIFEVTRTVSGEPCYVMPLLAKGNLAARPRPMAEHEVRPIIARLLEALGHAHAAGVVHRDVKLENVLFDVRDQPLLADFGVALKLSGERMTRHGLAVGSSQTMSPEQARGEAVDGRSDLYSVGCIAFELLTGRPPFEGDDFLQVAFKHQQDPVPDLPPRLAHWQGWFERALAKQPAQRYGDAAAMAAAMDAIAPPSDVATMKMSVQQIKALEARDAPRQRWRWWLLAILLAGLGLLWLLYELGAPPPGEAQPAPSTAAIDSEGMAIERLIAAGALFPPAQPNAAEALAPLFQSEPVPAVALDLRDALLQAAAQRFELASAEQRVEWVPAWADFVAATRASSHPSVRASVNLLEQAWAPALSRARETRDRAEVKAWLAAAQALPEPSTGFAESLALVAKFPAYGESFRDAQGPALLLAPAARVSGLGQSLAVSARKISRGEYQAFVAATGHRPARCAGERRNPVEAGAAEAVVCVNLADAEAYAAWLSERSGRRYRLPQVAEWKALRSHAAAEPEAMPRDFASTPEEWTASCELKPIGSVRKAVVNLGRMLQGKDKEQGTMVCDGQYVIGASGERSIDADSTRRDLGFRVVREIR